MELIVYVDRLKEGKKELFSGEISTDFLEDKNLFENTLSLAGEAYVSGDHLILRLRAKTTAKLPCSICNESVSVPVEIDISHVEPLEDIRSTFHFAALLREDIFLQLPKFTECQEKCPEREQIKGFLKAPSAKVSSEDSAGTQFPFAGL
ncbi:MAG: DUF177 domain-containing protein [Rhabdochlamydiaceae bacterium]|nr:DUF177 domain-containing protein [Rhabdochlamydiaceae bacterium]